MTVNANAAGKISQARSNNRRLRVAVRAPIEEVERGKQERAAVAVEAPSITADGAATAREKCLSVFRKRLESASLRLRG
jgi:hypothetical protein